MALWKKLLLIGFSVGAGLVVATVSIFWAIYRYEQRPGPQKEWDELQIESKNLKATLKTKWRSGSVQFQLRLVPAMEEGKPAFHNALSRPRSHDGVSIRFSDSAGFEVCEISILDSDFRNSIDAAGKFAALHANSSGYCSREDFQAAGDWTLTWKALPDATPKVDTSAGIIDAPRTPAPKAVVPASEASSIPSLELKPPTVPERWKDRRNWRKLTRGMPKHQVRAILGEPSRTEDIGFEYWYYGRGNLLSGPYVEFDNDIVRGWKEP